MFKKPIDYPTDFLFSEINTFTLDQIYNYTLLTFFHKNKDNFNTFWHTRNTRRNNLFNFTESKYLTTAGLKHSSNYGLKLYNNFIYQFPDLEHNSILKFKLKN